MTKTQNVMESKTIIEIQKLSYFYTNHFILLET